MDYSPWTNKALEGHWTEKDDLAGHFMVEGRITSTFRREQLKARQLLNNVERYNDSIRFVESARVVPFPKKSLRNNRQAGSNPVFAAERRHDFLVNVPEVIGEHVDKFWGLVASSVPTSHGPKGQSVKYVGHGSYVRLNIAIYSTLRKTRSTAICKLAEDDWKIECPDQLEPKRMDYQHFFASMINLASAVMERTKAKFKSYVDLFEKLYPPVSEFLNSATKPLSNGQKRAVEHKLSGAQAPSAPYKLQLDQNQAVFELRYCAGAKDSVTLSNAWIAPLDDEVANVGAERGTSPTPEPQHVHPRSTPKPYAHPQRPGPRASSALDRRRRTTPTPTPTPKRPPSAAATHTHRDTYARTHTYTHTHGAGDLKPQFLKSREAYRDQGTLEETILNRKRMNNEQPEERPVKPFWWASPSPYPPAAARPSQGFSTWREASTVVHRSKDQEKDRMTGGYNWDSYVEQIALKTARPHTPHTNSRGARCATRTPRPASVASGGGRNRFGV